MVVSSSSSSGSGRYPAQTLESFPSLPPAQIKLRTATRKFLDQLTEHQLSNQDPLPCGRFVHNDPFLNNLGLFNKSFFCPDYTLPKDREILGKLIGKDAKGSDHGVIYDIITEIFWKDSGNQVC